MVDLTGVRWLGGGSGAGKSSVADLLGRRSGVPVVRTDLSLRAHAAAEAGDPAVDAFVAMSADLRWVERDPETMLDTFPWFRGAGFDRLLAELPVERPLLVEGFRLLPRLVAPHLAQRRLAVWLLPSPEQRRRVLLHRSAVGRAFWERTSDPGRAFENVLERDRLLTERIRRDCIELGLPVVDVDGSESLQDTAERVAARLEL